MGQTLLDLGTQPLVNNLCNSAEEAMAADRHPLRAEYDQDLCIHLDTEIPPSVLYGHYLYKSGVSKPYVEHCEKMFDSLSHLRPQTIIDIGGNDGTLLDAFQRQSPIPIERINVDASASFKEENERKGIRYINALFSESLDLPKADVIISTNVFQHTKDIHSFLRGIKKHLNGVWVLEFPYTLTTLLTLQFDQFYHEHYYYWLVTPLAKLFAEYGLKIIYAKEMSIHGGTMRMWMTNKEPSASAITSVIDSYKAKEQMVSYGAFNDGAKMHIEKSKSFISSLEGRTVFFGAAAKGCVFLNALGLSIENMPNAYIVDDTPGKQGMFVPGTGFEICPRERLTEDKPDSVIILAHNFARHIVQSLRQDNYEGHIYCCLPSIVQF
jgi:hypothetical protein